MTPDGRVTAALPFDKLRHTARLLLIGLLAIGAVAAWHWKAVFDPVAITAAISHYPAAPLGFIAVHIAASLVFVPRTLLAVAAGMLFGTGWGITWGALGSVAGAIAGFLLARYLGSRLIEFRNGTRFALLERVEQGGWRAVAFLRLVPIIPHSFSNYGLGLTRLPLRAYAFGSLIGQLPLTIAYVEFGAAGEQLLAGGVGWIKPTMMGLAALSLSLLSPAYLGRPRR